MRNRQLIKILLTITWVMVAEIIVGCRTYASPRTSNLISLEEAEILVYLVPAAHVVRSQGMDIGWELQTSAKLNQADFYVFWVVDNKRPPGTEASNTIGYFGVNKHTADVWSLDDNHLVSSPELTGVQKIIREAHSISESVMKEYGSRRPELVPTPEK